MSNRTALTSDAIFPMLVAAGDIDYLSAQLWPLDVALVVLAREVTRGSEVERAIKRMPQATVPHGQRFVGLRGAIHRLVSQGALAPGGNGWDAGYAVAPAIKKEGIRMLGSLPPEDQVALGRAGQALSDATRMLSKNAAAAAPSGSATI